MMSPSATDTRGDAGWVMARTLRLGLDAARHPCRARYAEGADGTTRRCAAVRSLGLRSLAGDPARVVKPRRLRLWGARARGLRAPTPRVLRSAGGGRRARRSARRAWCGGGW